MLNLLAESPVIFILVALALVVSISIHEFAHAFIADRLGDPTPRHLGRLTLNPLSHLDPIGSIMLIVAGFGWGKPVPINPFNLKNPIRGQALVALAGPVSNFILAATLAFVLNVIKINPGPVAGSFLYLVILYNLFLGFFNLIPFGPLDGFKIVQGFLPGNLAVQWAEMERFGILILLLLVFTNSSGRFLSPLVDFSLRALGF